MSKPPKRFSDFLKKHPEVGAAYNGLSNATMTAGPLDKRTAQLVKLGIAIGMRHEGAVHAHARKALDAGCSPDELRHVAILGTTTHGFPNMMAAYSWITDIVDEQT
ncbi:MAG: carboxymuconolactone decarboxylase family protein [Rhodothermales bacterium]|nr:carboxymuconolactone decarboxylase family protein [Rhodothermales bacterium]